MIKPSPVYLAFGANLGDRESQLLEALRHIRAQASIEKVSGCYETKPVGYMQQPDFLNMACLILTEIAAPELLRFLKQIEKQMGRQTTFRNAPRPIDIDILFYNNLILESPELTIPHPRMSERAFVLVPLAEIAPEAVHPVLHLTVSEMLRQVDASDVDPIPRRLPFDLSRNTPPAGEAPTKTG
jgi:GTP cyclohydrolase-4